MPSELEGAHILYLEDDAIINLSTTQVLEELGCEVSAAVHLDDAWKIVRQQLPDAAVLDVHLHGDRTSYELATWLDARGVPILFATGYDTPAMQGKWLDHAMCRKPCGRDELEGMLVKALNRKLRSIKM